VFRQDKTNRHLIVDGQQRLKTLQYFYSGRFHGDEKVFKLVDVNDVWLGKTYNSLSNSDRRRLDDSILHTTIFRQDEPAENDQSVYEVFERINTGGVKLSAQEIRVCVNFGVFTELIREMNNHQSWRKIYGAKSPRLKDEELIVRFLAFSENISKYKRPLKTFLNKYAENNRDISKQRADKLKKRFFAVMDCAFEALGDKAFRPERALNAAVFDAFSVAINEQLEERGRLPTGSVRKAYNALMGNQSFRSLLAKATADEENVQKRFRMAQEVF
jgi:uncharacterized protein with ParB-like and HNH nuclease domain